MEQRIIWKKFIWDICIPDGEKLESINKFICQLRGVNIPFIKNKIFNEKNYFNWFNCWNRWACDWL